MAAREAQVGDAPAPTQDDSAHPHPVFAPGTPREYVDLFDDAPYPSDDSGSFAPFTLTNRWSTTASDGGGLGQGDPTTLTWSIALDGTSIPGFNGEPSAVSDLRAFLDGIYGNQATWLPLLQSTVDRWSELTGLTYLYEPADDGAAFSSNSNAAPGLLGVRGDVRIGGHFIDGNAGILAYNFFPNNGEMVIDTADSFYSNLANNSRRLRSVLAHEEGHGIGLRHVESNNASFLMEPFINTSFDGPQFDDILGAQRHYGDFYETAGNETTANATDLGVVADGATVRIGTDGTTPGVSFAETDFVSIDDDADIDVFEFEITSAADVDLLLTPVGPTYNQGPQGGTQTSFNASAQSNLQLQLIDNDGSTVLATANSNPVGGQEMISSAGLAAGVYYVRVSGAQNAAQMYQLEITANYFNQLLVSSVEINQGNAQRSMLTEMQVTFTSLVAWSSDAFTVEKRSDTLPGDVDGTVSATTGLIVTDITAGGSVTTLELTFDGSAVNPLINPLTNSLVDGNYQLRIDAAKVFAGAMLLDGNGDGTGGDDFYFGQSAADKVFALYGDGDGDGDVDINDIDALVASVGSVAPAPAYDSAFDSDNNGIIDVDDIDAFVPQVGKVRKLGGF